MKKNMTATITRTIRIVFFSILIILESIIYLIPILTLCLIPNFVITIIWYLPSIYQLYSYIFIKKKLNLRIRIYLFLFSPLIIIMYIPLCFIIFIGYSINIILIRRLMTVFLRPEYPIYSFSLTASLIYLIYQYYFDNEDSSLLLKDSIIIEIIITIIQFIKNCWNFNSIKISKKIQKYKINIFEIIFYKLIKFFDLVAIFLFLIIIIIFWIIFSLIVLIIYCCFSLPIRSFHDQLEEFLMEHEITIFLKILIFLIFFPIFYLIGVIYSFFMIIISFIFLWIIETIIEVTSTVIEIYNENGFNHVIDYFRIIIIKLILYVDNVIGIGLEALIYSWFEIYIYDCDDYVLQKANVIMKILELSSL
jgi:hypothetical protein